MATELGRDYLGNLTIGNTSIKSFDIMPNTFSDMIEMNNTNSVNVRLFNVVRHINPRNERVELSVKNNHKDDAYLLVFGGWIPCSFIKKNTLLLADRNVISEITSRYNNGKKKKALQMMLLIAFFSQTKSPLILLRLYSKVISRKSQTTV
ncbi:hypothetical protein K3H30_05600 [Aeromonas veronii]|uniref:hypothetical protein n=1 Tax=Aeromonas veronii TaxID=654 RepID=UPI001F1D22D4|nr:hypothetical protein [Aeromonas veronii]MCF5717184.1 hypothetical protein [Aeromonas veronii]